MVRNKTLKQIPSLTEQKNDIPNDRQSQLSTSGDGMNEYYEEHLITRDEKND